MPGMAWTPAALLKSLDRTVWRSPIEGRPRGQAWLLRLTRLAIVLVRDLAQGQLTLRAMGLVYTTLLSLVPLLALSFSVLKAFGVYNQIRPMLLGFLGPPRAAPVHRGVARPEDRGGVQLHLAREPRARHRRALQPLPLGADGRAAAGVLGHGHHRHRGEPGRGARRAAGAGDRLARATGRAPAAVRAGDRR